MISNEANSKYYNPIPDKWRRLLGQPLNQLWSWIACCWLTEVVHEVGVENHLAPHSFAQRQPRWQQNKVLWILLTRWKLTALSGACIKAWVGFSLIMIIDSRVLRHLIQKKIQESTLHHPCKVDMVARLCSGCISHFLCVLYAEQISGGGANLGFWCLFGH